MKINVRLLKILGRLGFLGGLLVWAWEYLLNHEWIMLALIGTIGGMLYRLIPKIFNWIKSRFIVSCKIEDAELENILSAFVYEITKNKTKNIRAEFDKKQHTDDSPKVQYFAGEGIHLFYYNKKWYWLSQEEHESKSGLEFSFKRKTATLSTYDNNLDNLKRIIQDASDIHFEKIKDKVAIYFNGEWGEWKKLGVYSGRPLDTVSLKENQRERILNDIKKFFNSNEWYDSVGMPYRRGYLFYGPPGTGKSSLAKAIATELNCNLYVTNLANSTLNDANLLTLIGDVRPKSIVLMEDIDAVLDSSITRADNSKLTMSGLLNAIDGVAAQEGKIIIMTTNNPEMLEDKLIRPGRIDVKEFFGLADKKQIQDIWQNLFRESGTDFATLFSELVEKEKYSPAEIQGYLLKYRHDPPKAIDEWRKFNET